MFRTRRLLLVSLLLALLICGARAQSPVWAVGSPAPAITAYDETGAVHHLSDFLGQYVVFDVSAAWCYPCFQLAYTLDAVKQRLASQGVQMSVFTAVVEDPLKNGFTLRSQAQAWKENFPFTDVVTAMHIGLGDFVTPYPAARSLLRTQFPTAFPTYAIIDPSGNVVEINVGAPSPDDLLAKFLPNQDPLTAENAPVTIYSGQKATIGLHIGEKWARSQKPFFDASGAAYVVPPIREGSLPHDFGLGISREVAASQEIWTLHYDTGVAKGPDDKGIPAEAPITFTIENIDWLDRPAVLVEGEASLNLFDNVLPPSILTVPVTYHGNKIVVGPFKAGAGFYYFHYIQVHLYFAKNDPHLLSIFGADETARQLSLNDEQRALLVEQWRGIERALTLTPGLPEMQLAVSRIRTLWHSVSHMRSLPNGEKRVLIGMLTRMKFTLWAQERQLRRGLPVK
jgi:hypothetical protein